VVAQLAVARTMLQMRLVAGRSRDRDDDRIDILVYMLWAAVLLILLRYI
jgi:hypothetical protein